MATSNKNKFFKELLTLCKKYKVNMENTKIEFYSDFDEQKYYEVEINGSWDIREDQDQLSAYEFIPQKVESVFSIKGTKKI